MTETTHEKPASIEKCDRCGNESNDVNTIWISEDKKYIRACDSCFRERIEKISGLL